MTGLLTSAAFAKIARNAQDSVLPEVKGVRKTFALAEPVVKGAGENTLRFVISTEDIDRSGDRILVAGWRLENYLKNPVVLWAHDYKSPPCAKSVSLGIENSSLVSTAQFAVELDPFFKLVYELYAGGYMRAVSVGLNPLKWQFAEAASGRLGVDYVESELLEYSCVPVPANPNALIQARAVDGIDTMPMKKWAEEHYDRLGDLNGGMVGGVWLPKDFLVTLIKSSDDREPVVGALPACDINIFEAEPEEGAPGQAAETTPEGEAPAPDSGAPAQEADETPPDAGEADTDTDSGGEAEGGAEGGEALVANPEMAMPEGSPVFRHHLEDGSVVFRGVAGAMGALLRGEVPAGRELGVAAKNCSPEEAYEHIARHYREDFDLEPPERRFVAAQVLKHFSDVFVFDMNTGVLSAMSEGERDARVLAGWLDDATQLLEGEAVKRALGKHPRKAEIESLVEKLKGAIQSEDGGSGGPQGEGGAEPPEAITLTEGMVRLDDAAAFVKDVAGPLIREEVGRALRDVTGRLE